MELRRLLTFSMVALFAVSVLGCQDTTREVRFDEDTQESRAQGEVPGRSHSKYPKYSGEEQVLSLRELPAGREHEYYVNEFRDLQFDVEAMRMEGNRIVYWLVRNDETYRVVLTKQEEGTGGVITAITVEEVARETIPERQDMKNAPAGA